jgi:hypothetical protein
MRRAGWVLGGMTVFGFLWVGDISSPWQTSIWVSRPPRQSFSTAPLFAKYKRYLAEKKLFAFFHQLIYSGKVIL